MRTFEKALRLLLDLHTLMDEGKSESEEADKIRDEMDGPWGWHGGSHEEDLTQVEKELLDRVSVALYGKDCEQARKRIVS